MFGDIRNISWVLLLHVNRNDDSIFGQLFHHFETIIGQRKEQYADRNRIQPSKISSENESNRLSNYSIFLDISITLSLSNSCEGGVYVKCIPIPKG